MGVISYSESSSELSNMREMPAAVPDNLERDSFLQLLVKVELFSSVLV